MERLGGRYLAGLVVIAFGIVALLNNFGFTAVSLGYLFNLLWPLLIVVAGINFIARRDPAGLITGAILTALGVAWFGRNAGWLDIDMSLFWKAFWPVLIIIIGLNIMLKNEHNSRGNIAIMGSVEKKHEPWELRSAEYTAFMGGIDLDIRKARFTQPEITLTLSAIMGGISVILPPDVAVTCNGTSILGGIDLMGRGSGGILGSTSMQSGDLKNSDKILHLKCTTIMGGIEIKQ
jgi:predicted membrane protein